VHTHFIFEVNFNWYQSLVHSKKINFLNAILTSILSMLSMDKIASISHDMSVHKTMFIKPIMSHTQSVCEGKWDKQSIPTCHHCGIVGHICPNCFQIRS
jgi:hypothetical protein